jgi:hypothetical protein
MFEGKQHNYVRTKAIISHKHFREKEFPDIVKR